MNQNLLLSILADFSYCYSVIDNKGNEDHKDQLSDLVTELFYSDIADRISELACILRNINE